MVFNAENQAKICVVIPAHNEAASVARIIQAARKYIDIIYVVDNKSTDETASVARDSGAHIIHYSEKLGYGAAQYAGQQAAISSGFDYILQLDADGQHNPIYIPELLKVALTGDYDIVLGSRFLNNKPPNLSFIRKAGITFLSAVVSFLGHTKITDVTSGFKVYKASSLKKLNRPSDIHPCPEQMLEIARKGMKIKEVPVDMLVRNTGRSYFTLLRYVLYPFRVTWAVVKVMLFR